MTINIAKGRAKMLINREYSIVMREGRRLLRGNEPMQEIRTGIPLWPFVVGLVAALVVAGCVIAHAEIVDRERLADAIYIAEGCARTSHPYGIMARYRHTTPRQACINTIQSALNRWNGQGDFVAYLGSTYCPVGAANDPDGLNVNWIKNVKANYAGV